MSEIYGDRAVSDKYFEQSSLLNQWRDIHVSLRCCRLVAANVDCFALQKFVQSVADGLDSHTSWSVYSVDLFVRQFAKRDAGLS